MSCGLAFIPALVVIGIPGLLAVGDKRNGIFLVILGLFLAANGMLHFDVAGDLAVTLVVDLLALLVCVLGGRIVPSFTRNALAAKGLDNAVRTSTLAHGLAVGSVVAVVLGDLAAAQWDQVAPLAAGLALAAAVANGWRMAGWGARYTLDSPMVWSLHLGYGWLVAGPVVALRAGPPFAAGPRRRAQKRRLLSLGERPDPGVEIH